MSDVIRPAVDLRTLDVLLVQYRDPADLPTLVPTTLVIDTADAARVDDLPEYVDPEESGEPLPSVGVTDRPIHGGRYEIEMDGTDCIAFPIDEDEEDEDDARSEVIGHVGVDSGMVWLGDPCYIAGRDSDALVDSILGDQPDGISTPLGALGGIAVATPDGDGVFPVLVHRDGDGRVLRVEIDFTL